MVLAQGKRPPDLGVHHRYAMDHTASGGPAPLIAPTASGAHLRPLPNGIPRDAES